MSRRYADPIQVRLAPGPGDAALDPPDGAPAAFWWRRDQYRVVAVLGRWVEAGAWWRDAVPGRAAIGECCDRVVWRVEARAETRVGVFDLGHDVTSGPPAGDRWLLVRALD